MNKTLLVTGGAGFIGANFVHYWLEANPQDKVIVLDALTYAGNLKSLKPVESNPNFTFVKGDICNTELVEKLLDENKVNTIVHFAAESHVDRSITGPDAFIETNILGTYSLLKSAKKLWIDEPKAKGNDPIAHRFHHVSTDEVYGTLAPNDPAFTEDTAYAPNSPYSASKAASDHLVRAYHHTYGLEVTTSNCSNNYGPYHFPEKLIPLIITNILNDKPLPIYGDGQQVRDWLYVEDHARGIELVLKKGCIGENYNIGGHNEWANIDIVKLICQQMNKQFAKTCQSNESQNLAEKFPQALSAINGKAEELIIYVTDRAGHDRRYAIDATKTNNELGYKPKESFETGFEKTLVWYLNNHPWWQSILDGTYQDK
ncbi:dTDP-glucose 4,6-dehydratase [Thalassotalea eurytherma]|uniref:dTDP-glucose 4,6-dehydratase n=1 Tax=Thalassotalea eurytherma TaxID=1144278 RepID=A0ABQ6GZC9_9GAMM|nr:dTDP-glucose 4,6-dehydratase [Thalassotalea eurytherma]GLX81303.1 dTDP-glucose 4,6-dehydratase [Thalassotalea eurytherma]